MKKKWLSRSLFWGIALILTAALLIADGIGISFGESITPLQLICGGLLTALLIYEIIRLRFARIFFPLAFLFLLFEAPLGLALGKGEDLISNWVVLLAALLLTAGTSMILPDKKIKTKGGVGDRTLYLDANNLDHYRVSENVGKVQIYFINKEQYPGNGSIDICENVGAITLHVPAEWNVVTHVRENLGKIRVPEQSGGEKTLIMYIQENLGNISVIFD